VYQRILAVREVFDQPITVTKTVERLPAVDILPLRCIIDDIQRFLKIGIPAAQRKGIEVQTKDDVNVVGDLGRQIGGIGLGTLPPFPIESQFLEFT